jgi:hypothetical protein
MLCAQINLQARILNINTTQSPQPINYIVLANNAQPLVNPLNNGGALITNSVIFVPGAVIGSVGTTNLTQVIWTTVPQDPAPFPAQVRSVVTLMGTVTYTTAQVGGGQLTNQQIGFTAQVQNGIPTVLVSFNSDNQAPVMNIVFSYTVGAAPPTGLAASDTISSDLGTFTFTQNVKV